MKKPNLKNSFSVDDIHKIREYNYERTKDLTKDELITFVNSEADKIRKKINKSKRKKIAI